MRRWTDYHYKSVGKKKKKEYFDLIIKTNIHSHLIESFKKAVFILSAPRLPLPTGPLLVTSLFLLLSRPLAFGSLGNPPCGASHEPRLSSCPLGGRAVLCPCCHRKVQKYVSVETPNKKHTHTNIPVAKYICVVKSVHEGTQGHKNL